MSAYDMQPIQTELKLMEMSCLNQYWFTHSDSQDEFSFNVICTKWTMYHWLIWWMFSSRQY